MVGFGTGRANPYRCLAAISLRLDKPRHGFIALERNLARAFLDERADRQGQSLNAARQAGQARILDELSPIEKRIAVLVGRSDLSGEETKELEEKIAARTNLYVELTEMAAEWSAREVSDGKTSATYPARQSPRESTIKKIWSLLRPTGSEQDLTTV